MLVDTVTRSFSITAHPTQVGLQVGVGSSLSRRPWAGQVYQLITTQTYKDKQPCTPIFQPKGDLEKPIRPTCVSLGCGRKQENPCKQHATPHQKATNPGSEPRSFLWGYSTTHRITMLPC